jgi:hypothetical protein
MLELHFFSEKLNILAGNLNAFLKPHWFFVCLFFCRGLVLSVLWMGIQYGSQILERLWGPLTTLHFHRCGVEPVTIGCCSSIGNKHPPSWQVPVDPTSGVDSRPHIFLKTPPQLSFRGALVTTTYYCYTVPLISRCSETKTSTRVTFIPASQIRSPWGRTPRWGRIYTGYGGSTIATLL